MTEMPERVWVNPTRQGGLAVSTVPGRAPFFGDEYIRADLVPQPPQEPTPEAVERAAWQPIETAPREPVEPYGSAPILLLASASGHRALGYWGKGRRNTDQTWIALHDHMPISYWNALEFWMIAPSPPAALTAPA